jgi:fatty acid desaturase
MIHSQPNDLPGLDTVTLRDALGDLHKVKPWIYWLDFSLSAAAGWTLFAIAVAQPLFSWRMFLLTFLAAMALYRAVSFIHELSHHRQQLKGFETVFNWVVGFEVFMPSFMHAEPHASHHRISSFGTVNDPEYMPFAHSRKLILLYTLQAVASPPMLVARFLLMGPAGFFSRQWERTLIRRGSALTLNPQYQRDVNDRIVREVRLDTAMIMAVWGAVGALAYFHVLPLRIFLVWWLLVTTINFTNTMRTLAAHEYDHTGAVSRNDQWADTIDAEGSLLAEVWAPVGLRYHAVHHFLPGIPYYNLPQAHRRLSRLEPFAAANRERARPGIYYTLRELVARARMNSAGKAESSTAASGN